MKMRFVSVTALAAAAMLLNACSEADMCVWRNTADLRAAESRLEELEANLARGYAIHTSTEPYEYRGVCRGRDGKPYECTKTDYRTVEKPVTIDIPDHRRQVADIRSRLPGLRAAAERARAECGAAYPD